MLARPGAASRRPEVAAVAERLRRHCDVVPIEPPATLDGGDVLVVDRRVWIGLSRRTNGAAAAQVRTILEPYGYEVATAPVNGCLHFKSAATAAAAETIVLNPAWVDASLFDGFRVVEVDPAEPFAANVLRLNDVTVVPADAPRTRVRLESAGVACVPVDASELAKAEGGLTCCSLLITS